MRAEAGRLRNCPKISRNRAVSSGAANRSQTCFPIASTEVYPVVCSHARLKRTMRPPGSRHQHQGADRVHHRGGEVALFLERLFGALKVGDIEADAVNEPRAAIWTPHHAGVTVKPDRVSVAGKHPVNGAQRPAGKEHFSGFRAPTALVVGMNSLIPADRIFQPFLLREPEHGFDLRIDVSFSDAAVEIDHEDHGRDLLDQGSIPGLEVGSFRILPGAAGGRVETGRVKEDLCEAQQDIFRVCPG